MDKHAKTLYFGAMTLYHAIAETLDTYEQTMGAESHVVDVATVQAIALRAHGLRIEGAFLGLEGGELLVRAVERGANGLRADVQAQTDLLPPEGQPQQDDEYPATKALGEMVDAVTGKEDSGD